MVLSAEEADDASWSSMVVRREVGGGSARQMPVREECPKWSRAHLGGFSVRPAWHDGIGCEHRVRTVLKSP